MVRGKPANACYSGMRHDGQLVKQREMSSLLGTAKPGVGFVRSHNIDQRLWNHGMTAEFRVKT